jgi:hypothetical protein
VDNVVEKALKAVAHPEALSCRVELVKKASNFSKLRAVKASPDLRYAAAHVLRFNLTAREGADASYFRLWTALKRG